MKTPSTNDATVQLAGEIVGVTAVERPSPTANAGPGPQAPAKAVARTDQPGAPDAAAAAEKAIQAERAELARNIAAAKDALRQAIALQQSVAASAERHVVELAIDVARKVLMQEIQAERYEIDPIVRAALDQVTNWREVVVHLNPADFVKCSLAGEAAQNESAGESGVRFVADPTVKPAECYLETVQGQVRSAVSEHLDDIASAMLEPQRQ